MDDKEKLEVLKKIVNSEMEIPHYLNDTEKELYKIATDHFHSVEIRLRAFELIIKSYNKN